MAVLRLHLDEFDEIDYDLVAIHSSLEDYRLAYFLNQKLSITLCKSNEDVGVTIKEGEAQFPKFTYDDKRAAITWNLVPNKNEVKTIKQSTAQNLFRDTPVEVSTKVYLLPELRKVDYFLKIENNCHAYNLTEVMKEIKSISRISTVYKLIPDSIKSKNNLIF